MTAVRKLLNKTWPYSQYQFALWRIIFGAYLTFYHLAMLPYVVELFSGVGMFNNNIIIGPFPNLFYLSDAPEFVYLVGLLSVLLSVCIMIGYRRNVAALILWFLYASFVGRNFLTEEPATNFVGLLILLLAIIPRGEPLSFSKSSRQWSLPYFTYVAPLVILGLSYTISGYDKFLAAGWLAGDAMYYLYTTVVAWDYWFTELLRKQPLWLIQLQTWAAAAIMLIALPALLWKKSRFITWLLLTFMFGFITLVLDIEQVTLGILLFHFFLFDRRWVPGKNANSVKLWYDTNCNLCQRYIHFLQTEDWREKTNYHSIYDRVAAEEVKSIIFEVDGQTYTKSAAVIQHFLVLGGIWRVIASVMLVCPRLVRDKIYDFVARNRYRWFGTCDCT